MDGTLDLNDYHLGRTTQWITQWSKFFLKKPVTCIFYNSITERDLHRHCLLVPMSLFSISTNQHWYNAGPQRGHALTMHTVKFASVSVPIITQTLHIEKCWHVTLHYWPICILNHKFNPRSLRKDSAGLLTFLKRATLRNARICVFAWISKRSI